MQDCPYCGTSLPDKASFCAHCGHSLTATHASTNQSANKSGQTGKPGNDDAPKTPAHIAGPKTPELDTVGTIAEQMTLLLPPPLPAPTSGEAEHAASEEAASAIQKPDKTPSLTPDKTVTSEAAHAVPASQKTSLPKETTYSEEQHMRKNPQEAHTPPSDAEHLEAQRTIAIPPPPRKPVVDKAAAIEAQKTRAVPAAKNTPLPTGPANIEAQKTQIVPAMGKTPAPAPASGKPLDEQETLTLFEAQKTLPITAVDKSGQRGQPGTHPRTEVYSDGTFVIYKGTKATGGISQRTGQMPAIPRSVLPGSSIRVPVPPKPTRANKLKARGWQLISPVFVRALDPDPERNPKPEPQGHLLGWWPVIALTSALGLFTVATAYNASRDLTPGAELYFWLGVILMFIPPLIRMILPQASRVERVGLICTTTICIYLNKVTLSPLRFNGYDEFLHWNTINDIVSTGHLFSANSLLPVSPFYPGLEIVASAITNMSGLSTVQSGMIVVGMACLLMTISIFLLGEQLSGSTRLASIATMIYMTNPHFMFFDTQFAYESLALPLATFVMFAMTRYETLYNNRRWVMLAAWIVLIAMILTHHLTNFAFEGIFMLWTVVYMFLRPLPLRKSIVILTLIVGMALTVITVLLIGNTVIGYFTSFFKDVGSEIAQSLSTDKSGRQLFNTAGVQPTPFWERMILLGSVGLITLSIPFLLLCFWRRYRRNTLVWVFAIIIIFYPVLQVLRLTTSGAEASDRASAFVFIAISFLRAVAIVQFWPVRFFTWRQPALISAIVLLLFMGGIILGEGIPPSFMPGPYVVSADGRSVEPEGINAALWALKYLGPDNRIYTDRVNQLLMSVYGNQYIVTQIGDNIDETDVFFDNSIGSYETSLLQRGQVHYLVVDMRLSQGLPVDGYYFEQGEPVIGDGSKPMPATLLTKFDTVPQINRLFDSGNIAIYDTGGLINAPQKP